MLPTEVRNHACSALLLGLPPFLPQLDSEPPLHMTSSVLDLLTDRDKVADWIETLLTVPTEDRGIIPYSLTAQQKRILQNQTGRDITIKGRQTRASSVIMARNVRRMTTEYGLNCVVVTQTDQMTQNFRERIKHHIRDLAANDLKYEITADNTDYLELGRMHNKFHWGSAESKVGLRGIQTAHIIHASEVAHWPEDSARRIIGGLIPACPPFPHGWFDMESTPNGADGLFYNFAMDSMPLVELSMWTSHFYPWWLEPAYTVERLEGMPFDVQRLKDAFKPEPEEHRLMEEYRLTPGQMLWRRLKTQELLKTGQYFAQEYPEDMMSCWLSAGTSYFHDEQFDHIGYYQRAVRAPGERLTQLSYRHPQTGQEMVIEFLGPNLQIWERPIPGRIYVAFQDTSAGVSGDGDYSALVIVERETRHHVATLRVRTLPQRVGQMAAAVCQLYNSAFLGIERNTYGQAAIQAALGLGYRNLYYDVINQPNKPELGWFTSESSRDRMLGSLRESVFNHALLTYDQMAVTEMDNFTWEKIERRGKPIFRAEASRGHDDMVIALAGALTIAPYAPGKSSTLVLKDTPGGYPGSPLVDQFGVVQAVRAGGHQNWMR